MNKPMLNNESEAAPLFRSLLVHHTNGIENTALKFHVMAYGEGVLDTIGNDACAPTLCRSDKGPIAGEWKRSIWQDCGSSKLESFTDQFILQASPRDAVYTPFRAQAEYRTSSSCRTTPASQPKSFAPRRRHGDQTATSATWIPKL